MRRRGRGRLVLSVPLGLCTPSSLPVPLLNNVANTSSSNVMDTAMASSFICTTTSVMTSPIMLSKPDFSQKPISDSLNKPSRKRKREHSCSSSNLSHDMIWAELQYFMAFHSAAGHSSSSCRSHSLGRLPLTFFCCLLQDFLPLPALLITGHPAETSLLQSLAPSLAHLPERLALLHQSALFHLPSRHSLLVSPNGPTCFASPLGSVLLACPFGLCLFCPIGPAFFSRPSDPTCLTWLIVLVQLTRRLSHSGSPPHRLALFGPSSSTQSCSFACSAWPASPVEQMVSPTCTNKYAFLTHLACHGSFVAPWCSG